MTVKLMLVWRALLGKLSGEDRWEGMIVSPTDDDTFTNGSGSLGRHDQDELSNLQSDLIISLESDENWKNGLYRNKEKGPTGCDTISEYYKEFKHIYEKKVSVVDKYVKEIVANKQKTRTR